MLKFLFMFIPNKTVLYTDIDGTLVGKAGSLFHTPEGKLSRDATKALFKILSERIELVLVSSRNNVQLKEISRLLGSVDFISELGGEIYLTGRQPLSPSEKLSFFNSYGGPVNYLKKKNIINSLRENFSGLLEPHSPWTKNRTHTYIFRACLNSPSGGYLITQLNDFLRKRGLDFKFLDNGKSRRREKLSCSNNIRIFHLTPAAISKAKAVEKHLSLKDYNLKIAFGDSPADLEICSLTDQFYFFDNLQEFKRCLSILEASNLKYNISRSSDYVWQIEKSKVFILNKKGPSGFKDATERLLS